MKNEWLDVGNEWPFEEETPQERKSYFHANEQDYTKKAIKRLKSLINEQQTEIVRANENNIKLLERIIGLEKRLNYHIQGTSVIKEVV